MNKTTTYIFTVTPHSTLRIKASNQKTATLIARTISEKTVKSK